MLHEEVEINWETIQNIIQDFSVFEKIRSELIVGVSNFNCRALFEVINARIEKNLIYAVILF